MYAVFKDGGHQFRATAGDRVTIELRPDPPGTEVVFDQVLLIGGETTRIGTPTLSGARVVAVVEDAVAGPKLHGVKKRDKDCSRTRFGHRQKYTSVMIKEIVTG
jgi:large subunit ribosomal protein L21